MECEGVTPTYYLVYPRLQFQTFRDVCCYGMEWKENVNVPTRNPLESFVNDNELRTTQTEGKA